MAPTRKLPAGLKAQAAQRSEDAVQALNRAMVELRAEFEENGYDLAEPLSIKDVQDRAGLNAKFLYGKKHRKTTKADVEKFVDEINSTWVQRQGAGATETPLSRARADAAYWQQRHAQLASRVNGWFHDMRQQRRTIRDQKGLIEELRSSSGKVVRLTQENRDG